MQKLDRATLLELQWRDWLLWPLARPAGFIYEYIGHPLIEAVSHTFLIGTKPFGLPRFIRKPFKPRFLRKEILTLANVATLYSFFLFPQLLYLMWAYLRGVETVTIYSLSTYFFDFRSPNLMAIVWLTAEIFFIDLIDGPLARVNKAVTALGTILDHTRDYLTVFAALFFLVALTIRGGDWLILAGEIILFVGFAFIMWSYIYKYRRARAESKNYRLRVTEFIRRYALDKYQTPLLGRIQFWTIGSVIVTGLVFYANGAFLSSVLFPLAILVSIITTYYYFFILHYRERAGTRV